MFVCLRVRLFVCVCVSVCPSVCLFDYVLFAYAFKQTNNQTHNQPNNIKITTSKRAREQTKTIEQSFQHERTIHYTYYMVASNITWSPLLLRGSDCYVVATTIYDANARTLMHVELCGGLPLPCPRPQPSSFQAFLLDLGLLNFPKCMIIIIIICI